VLLVLFRVFPPNIVAKAFAKDSVIFVMGVLALAAGIARTGLDRRIGLILLGTSRSIRSYLFLFCPLLAVTAAFLSEHALVAFLAPLLMVVYLSATRTAGIKKDKALVVTLVLALCFAANQGGPGSPAAGGRNAVMIGILSDYNMAPSFGTWVKYGLPFVPVMALAIAAYFYLRFRKKIQVKNVNVAAIVRKESEKLGKMTRDEYITAGILVLVIVLWITASNQLGMGGPALIGLVLLAAFRLISWKNINSISWDVVALYAAASGIGVALANTGAAMWLASMFVDILPEALRSGSGLAMASSLITGILTNFMSDGATVAAVGPVTVPMAAISGSSGLMVGLATAFASSFANCFIIGTPNNAMAYALARDPETGEQLVTMADFLKHGAVVTGLGFLVLWGWTIYGYWRWIGF
jgi:sodium-dependent dicarboxylate transporter 2/3/5